MMNSSPPPLNLDSIFEFLMYVWNSLLNLMRTYQFKVGNFQFSVFDFFLALFVLGIVMTVVLNVVKSSAMSIGENKRVIDRMMHKEVQSMVKSRKGDKGGK